MANGYYEALLTIQFFEQDVDDPDSDAMTLIHNDKDSTHLFRLDKIESRELLELIMEYIDRPNVKVHKIGL